MKFFFPWLACLLLSTGLDANPTSAARPDYTGIWRLDDRNSDSADDIHQRALAEYNAEQAPSVTADQPASASSSGTSGHGHGGHGGGRGMGGGRMGGGRGGHHNNASKPADKADAKPPKIDPPPLLDKDTVLNVQQDASTLSIALDNGDRIEGRLDHSARQTLNGNAVSRIDLTPQGLQVDMQFDNGVRLQQIWTQSADGQHLTVTEQWTLPEVKQSISFKRRYDRLEVN